MLPHAIGGQVDSQKLNDNFSYLDSEKIGKSEMYYINPKDFGAMGDGIIDDTLPLQLAIYAAKGKKLLIPAGVYKITDTLFVPRNTSIEGAFNSSWFTFGQKRNELPDSILDMENGTILKFVGNGSKTFNTNRSDFQNLTCAVKLENDADGVNISNLKILNDFRIRDGSGNITTPSTDNSSLFDVGLWIQNADSIKIDNVSVVGYWRKVGVLVDGSGRISEDGENGGCEYISLTRSTLQGKIGLALVGGDEGNPPNESGHVAPVGDALSEGRFGLSHFFASHCFFSGTDHHSNGFVAGWADNIGTDSTPIFIDGYIGSGIPYRINSPRFTSCSIQTRESASVIMNRVHNPIFVGCRAENAPIRATSYTTRPQLIACEFPYSRSDKKYQEIEHCDGAVHVPEFRRLSHVRLREYSFTLELRNNGGVIEHRLLKSGSATSNAKSHDVERILRYPIKEAGWVYNNWTPTPVPSTGAPDNYSKGLFLGEKSFTSKYSLFTAIPFEDDIDYQEVTFDVLEYRGSDSNLHVRGYGHTAESVPYRIPSYSSCLKIEFRNGTSPANSLLTSLPNESNGEASLRVMVKGKFYEQSYGLI